MPPRRTPRLQVWIDDEHVADLVEPRSRQIRLEYTKEALGRYALGDIVLSASLPVRPQPYSAGETWPFLEGLLPEGEARTRIEERFDVPRGDTYRLLEAIGRDCAGAVAILPAGQQPVADLAAAESVDDAGLAEAIADLAEHPLGIEADVRLSLAGMQEKLLLTRLPTGGWARPRGGTPSTHILKPEPARFPGMVALEAFGLRLAEAIGLPAAHTEVLRIEGGRPVLAVARYDRRVTADGDVRRIHQEDLCQALGILPTRKYESDGGPSFRQIADIVLRIATRPRAELARLVQIMALTVALGNTDAHGRNLALLYDRPAVQLAPLYDVVPTLALQPRAGEPALSTRLAMSVNGVPDIREVTGKDLLREAARWVPEATAFHALTRTFEAMVEAAAGVAAQLAEHGAPLPPEAADLIQKRTRDLFGSL
ncbi:HipA domain-containing protein [Actinomycetes bacterium KLBMP 9797]